MWAMTIAGGRGERLLPLTDSICKPMVPVGGVPLLQHQAHWLCENGVSDIVFLTGYMADQVEEHFGDGSRFGFRAHYSPEDRPLGRGGAVKQGFGSVPRDVSDVVVVNGDVLTDQPLAPLVQMRRDCDAAAAITLLPYVSAFGVVLVSNDDIVTSFAEKTELPFWINGGIYVFKRGVEDAFPEIGDHETTTFPELVDAGQMRALRSGANWISVDSHKDLRDAEEMMSQGRLPRAFNAKL
jgi:NDP-sugar pyrophosphorylase family protein